MRKKHRKPKRQLKKQKKIILLSIITLTTLLSVGYATFLTNIKLTTTGKIKICYAKCQLKRKITTSGDGLYSDEYTNNRYVYRGANPDNYLSFNGIDAGFRIIAIEPNGNLKIIAKDSIGSIPFDSLGHRTYEDNTFCYNMNEDGCSIYASVIGNYSCNNLNGIISGTVTEDSEIKVYLNNTYYNSLNSDKNYIINHDFNIGTVYHTTSGVSNIVSEEDDFIWNGLIGLPNMSDYYNASLNLNCRNASANSSWINNSLCTADNNYFSNIRSWAINGQSGSSPLCGFMQAHHVGNGKSYNNRSTNPVFYLKSNIKLIGNGTEEEPYEIENENEQSTK